MTRIALHVLLGLHFAALACAAAVALQPAWDFFFDADLRLALYIGALLALYLSASLAVGFRRRRT